MSNVKMRSACHCAGMDLYFQRCDGRAVTVEDFVGCLADANHADLSPFLHWYTQAGQVGGCLVSFSLSLSSLSLLSLSLLSLSLSSLSSLFLSLSFSLPRSFVLCVLSLVYLLLSFSLLDPVGSDRHDI